MKARSATPRWPPVMAAAMWLAVTAFATEGAAAQDADVDRAPAHVVGMVVDAATGRPLEGALVVFGDERRAVLSDEDGVFDLGPVSEGPLVLAVRRYGYLAQEVDAVVPPRGRLSLEVALPPEAVLVDGFTVVAERLQTMDQRLRSRRTAVATSTRAHDQRELVRSAARDLLEFLQVEGNLRAEPCGRRGAVGCVRRRGQLVEPRVYVDEMLVTGGLDLLQTYLPYDLYLVEVFGRGQEIRAYTHLFMERMARRPVALIPIGTRW